MTSGRLFWEVVKLFVRIPWIEVRSRFYQVLYLCSDPLASLAERKLKGVRKDLLVMRYRLAWLQEERTR